MKASFWSERNVDKHLFDQRRKQQKRLSLIQIKAFFIFKAKKIETFCY